MQISRVIVFIIFLIFLAGLHQVGCLSSSPVSGPAAPPSTENTVTTPPAGSASSDPENTNITDTGGQTAVQPPVVYSSPGSVQCEGNIILAKFSLSNGGLIDPRYLCVDVKVFNSTRGDYEDLSAQSLLADNKYLINLNTGESASIPSCQPSIYRPWHLIDNYRVRVLELSLSLSVEDLESSNPYRDLQSQCPTWQSVLSQKKFSVSARYKTSDEDFYERKNDVVFTRDPQTDQLHYEIDPFILNPSIRQIERSSPRRAP